MSIWIQLIIAFAFLSCGFLFSFFFGSARTCWLFHSEQCIHALFTDSQIPLFSNFFIKNKSHGTIYTFKNYFVTVFSVSVFSFSKNKLNPNEPFVLHQYFTSAWNQWSFIIPFRVIWLTYLLAILLFPISLLHLQATNISSSFPTRVQIFEGYGAHFIKQIFFFHKGDI